MTDQKICNTCVMDTTDELIEFYEDGTCSNCRSFVAKKAAQSLNGAEAEAKIKALVKEMKAAGGEYDCVTGLSGGVDSTYVCYLLKELGLKPLVVHFDNGWNSELSIKNVEQTLKALEMELYTYVVDWEEFRELQLAFLKASTPDLEVTTDFAIAATLRKVADEVGVKYIITGSNVATEGVMGANWSRGHRDWRYIKSVNNMFSPRKLKSYPHYGLFKWFYYSVIKGQKLIRILNFYPYDKDEAMETIKREFGWKYYGGKHYESIITRFYQGYILPTKFGYDKRKGHLSALISSGQITRDEALEELKKPIYPDGLLAEDREYVIKKFGLTEDEFEEIMAVPPKSFFDYPSYQSHPIYKVTRFIYRAAKKFGLMKFVDRMTY